MVPSSELPPPTSSLGQPRNPLESESSVGHRLTETNPQAQHQPTGISSDLGNLNEPPTVKASGPRTTSEEVQEERSRRLREQMGAIAREGRAKVRDEAAEAFRVMFETFLETFQSSQQELLYVNRARQLRADDSTTLLVDFSDLMRFDERAGQALLENYLRLEPYMGQAATRLCQKLKEQPANELGSMVEGALEIAVSVYGVPAQQRVRELRADRIGRLSSIQGTVTRTSDVRPELVSGVFRCHVCGTESAAVQQQFKYTEPGVCEDPKCQNRQSWVLEVGRSKFADWQRVRVQENASEIPAGAMPRTLDVIVRGDLVEKLKPGDRAQVTGSLIAQPDLGNLVGSGAGISRARGGAGTGSRELSYRLAFVASHVHAQGTDDDDNKEEEEEMLADDEILDDMYGKLVASVAPTVYGHEEVKRGVLLQLLGGVHKRTSEGMRLRGDINVCIVGDPGTAKSQLLRYVAGLLPRAVLTSGKASSAAGLTASVVRDDETGEFTVEAGALMLADHGVCCIDEFDKMDTADQVAIHEAMEQQTISIAKAGIHATLNARASVLAAANPVGGRYDRRLTLRQNVAMTAPIMSRFDLFFVVLDDPSDIADYNTARHIVRVHQEVAEAAGNAPLSPAQLRRFIRRARAIQPVMREEAARLLWQSYRNIRQEDVGANNNSYRVTVRQLESLIRLSEALARAHLSEVVGVEHVREAVRLLRRSIVHVEADDVDVFEEEEEEEEEEAVQPTEIDVPEQQLQSQEPQEEQEEAEEPKSKKVTIRREDFDRVRAMLALRLHEESNKEETIRQKDLVDWYLEQREDQLETVEDLEKEQRLAKSVLKYMASVEGCVIAVRNQESEDIEDDPRGPELMLHPNFSIDS